MLVLRVKLGVEYGQSETQRADFGDILFCVVFTRRLGSSWEQIDSWRQGLESINCHSGSCGDSAFPGARRIWFFLAFYVSTGVPEHGNIWNFVNGLKFMEKNGVESGKTLYKIKTLSGLEPPIPRLLSGNTTGAPPTSDITICEKHQYRILGILIHGTRKTFHLSPITFTLPTHT